MSQKLQTELKKIAFAQPICAHCSVNPKAIKPYMKRVPLDLDDLTEKLLQSESEKTGVPKECIACIGFMSFMKLSTEDQLELLKNEFEWRKKHGYA
jgi:hypothetical protein